MVSKGLAESKSPPLTRPPSSFAKAASLAVLGGAIAVGIGSSRLADAAPIQPKGGLNRIDPTASTLLSFPKEEIFDASSRGQSPDTPLWQQVIPCAADVECGMGSCEKAASSSSSNVTLSKICACDEGVVHHPITGETCQYRQLKQRDMALASWLGGFIGADWQMAARGNRNYHFIGLMKVVSFVAPTIVGLCVGCSEDSIMKHTWRGARVGACALAAWWAVDAIRVVASTTSFSDGNEVPLKPF